VTAAIISDDEIRMHRDLCREFISESRLALEEVTSSPVSGDAAERRTMARHRCAVLAHPTVAVRASLAASLVREGSHVFIVDRDEKRQEIQLEQLEEMMLGIADMLRAARYWKERGE